jgi:hypothetical protein
MDTIAIFTNPTMAIGTMGDGTWTIFSINKCTSNAINTYSIGESNATSTYTIGETRECS